MRISFIGSGNVATHLALAMYNRGHVIEQVWSRTPEHASLLASRVEAEPITSFDQIRKTANIIIIALTDNALAEVAKDLHLEGTLVLHTSGATPIDVLKPCSSCYGTIWSPQTFVRDVALEYSELPFCIEGSDELTEDAIEEIMSMVSPHIYRTTFAQRQYLHLSSVFVNNFTNALYAVGQKLCRDNDVPFEILHPLIFTTAKKVEWGDVRYQMTGPALRGDSRTLDAHRALLSKDPSLLDLYNHLSRIILESKNF
ncbi:MAG: DUF2520 domain-containing protein [Bacteroidales bacterium]|nr:DUF2520 domain-containing protein [Bacteroidales bacterium]